MITAHNPQPGLWQCWVYQHVWAQITTFLSGNNTSPSCYEQKIRNTNIHTAVMLQAGNVGSPMQDSLDSSFFGSAAAKHMLKPGAGTLYPILSGNKPLVLPATGQPSSYQQPPWQQIRAEQ